MFTIFDGGSISGIVDGFAADLAASAALAPSSAAAAGQFEVDLAALYHHHADVIALYDRMLRKTQHIAEAAQAHAVCEASPIAGVTQSLNTTIDAAVGSSGGSSMVNGLQAVIDQIGAYADAVAAVYLSYVHADHEGATDLTAASNPHAASVTLPGGS